MKTLIKTLIILFLSSFISFVDADTIHVPGDYSSIQAAINSASAGDTVLVETGTYYENINFYGKAITVGSLFITTNDESYIENTIINAGGYLSCAKFNSGENYVSVLSGFTLTNGGNYYGAGINCYSGSSPTLSHLVIIDNHGDAGDSYGGGLTCMDASNPKVSNVAFINNDANEGGAVFCHNNSIPHFSNCVFSGNTSAHGGAMQISYSDPIIEYCLFYDNYSQAGGAVYVFSYSNPVFDHCTFSQNEGDWGGAIYCNELGGAPTIKNSVFWGDVSDYNLEIFATSTTYPPVVTYSNVENGEDQNWFGTGCIEQDPLFTDAVNYDFTLMPDSPCINAGDPMSPPDDDGSVTDMGAFPFLDLLPPGEAFEPIPADQSVEIELDQILSWTNGEYTEIIDLYFGTDNPPTELVLEDVNIQSFEPSSLEYGTTYYWQVVCKNDVGNTEGPVWRFTTDMNTGVSTEIAGSINIYPNPGNGIFSLSCFENVSQIIIYDAKGVQIKKIKNIKSIINLSDFENGLYLFIVFTKDDMSTLKVLKE